MASDSGYDFVRRYVAAHISKLSNTSNEGARKAELANLRRGLGTIPGSLPELWGALFGNAYSDDEQRHHFGSDDTPTREEWAIYTALTLFALHQQGHDIQHECMHRDKSGLGQAVGCLVKNQDDEERVLRRFNTVASAQDIQQLAYHLRSIVQLLRSESIPLDYAQLAADIYAYQNMDTRPKIRLRWGRDFYYRPSKEEKGDK